MSTNTADPSRTGADIAALEAEIEDLSRRMEAARQRARRLTDSEDPAGGVFHAGEIFEARQEKLRLQVEIERRRARINRLRFAG